jgi:hypothetical protein
MAVRHGKILGPVATNDKSNAWMHKPELTSAIKGSVLVSLIRSTCEVNLSFWKTFMDQGEELSFKMFKESPMYSSQTGFQQTVKDELDKMEALLKESEAKS